MFALLAILAAVPQGALYDRYCVACHGINGDGRGPAAPWLEPKPQDFTRGRYKWRSTPTGRPPTDYDLARTIKLGAPGTAMPGFFFDDAQVGELVDVVKGFAAKRFIRAPEVLTLPELPLDLSAGVARGHELFVSAGCDRCHEKGEPEKRFDLAREPLRRAQAGARDIFMTLATGLDGTDMPSYVLLPTADLWALAAYVDSIRVKEAPRRLELAKTASEIPLGFSLELHGPAPENLPPAARSLSAKQCGRCHAKELREWGQSLHAGASSPGLWGQFADETTGASDSCQKCHAPLAEQIMKPPVLRDEGINCAACHLDGFTRRGPARAVTPTLLAIPGYPFLEDARYERSDFCLPCHQLAPNDAVAGKPLLDTYREWLTGPYMRLGVQCQHCHMPNREHTWKGAHDPETVAQGLTMKFTATRKDESFIDVDVALENIGAGHFLPTTPTPAVFVDVAVLGRPGVLATARTRVGRKIRYAQDRWFELEDTRIPPGETLVFSHRLLAMGAERVRVTVTMAPDDYYEGLYRARIEGMRDVRAKARLETALARAVASRFVVAEEVRELLPR